MATQRTRTIRGDRIMSKKEFLEYIEGQLIPDLKEAEQNGTAEDMEILLRIAREGLNHA